MELNNSKLSQPKNISFTHGFSKPNGYKNITATQITKKL